MTTSAIRLTTTRLVSPPTLWKGLEICRWQDSAKSLENFTYNKTGENRVSLSGQSRLFDIGLEFFERPGPDQRMVFFGQEKSVSRWNGELWAYLRQAGQLAEAGEQSKIRAFAMMGSEIKSLQLADQKTEGSTLAIELLPQRFGVSSWVNAHELDTIIGQPYSSRKSKRAVQEIERLDEVARHILAPVTSILCQIQNFDKIIDEMMRGQLVAPIMSKWDGVKLERPRFEN